MDEKSAEALPLVLRHRHDAGHVVLLLAMFLLGEVSDEMATFAVVLGEHVEEERLDVVVERLMIEEQLGEEAEVLAIDLVGVAVHLEDGDVATPVDLGGGRVSPQTLVQVSQQHRPTLRVLQAELAQE